MVICKLSYHHPLSIFSDFLIFLFVTACLPHASQTYSPPLLHLAQRVPNPRSAYQSHTVTNFPNTPLVRSHVINCPCVLGLRAEVNLSNVPVHHIRNTSIDFLVILASHYDKFPLSSSQSPSFHNFPDAFRRNLPLKRLQTSRPASRAAVALAKPFYFANHAPFIVVLRFNGIQNLFDVSIILHQFRLSCPDVLPASASSSSATTKSIFVHTSPLAQSDTITGSAATTIAPKSTSLHTHLTKLSPSISSSLTNFLITSYHSKWQSSQSRPRTFVSEQVTPRIVGGHPAHQSHRQYMAAFTSGSRFLCSGSLISSHWIVTAAHCRITHSTQVTLGAARLPDGDKFSIETIIRHPSFVEEVDSPYDVALVRLSSSPSSSHIHPLLINANASHPPPKTYARVVGYGQTSEIARFDSLLRQVDVPIVAMDECRLRYRSANTELSQKLSDQWQICAGLDEGGCDACHGDSGGPLFTMDSPNANAVLVGIVSFGIGCARAYLPGVYARTSSFVPWFIETGAEFTVQNGTHFKETYVSTDPGSRSGFSIAGLSALNSIIIVCVVAVAAAALVAALLTTFGIPRRRQFDGPDTGGDVRASGRSSRTAASWGTPREDVMLSNDSCDQPNSERTIATENDEEAIMTRLAQWRREQGSSSSAYDTSEYFTPSEGTTCINMDDESFDRLMHWRENAAEAKNENQIKEPPTRDQTPRPQ